MPTDADTEAGRGEGLSFQRTADEVVRETIDNFLRQRVEHHERMADMVTEPLAGDHRELARAFEEIARLRQSDPGGEAEVCRSHIDWVRSLDRCVVCEMNHRVQANEWEDCTCTYETNPTSPFFGVTEDPDCPVHAAPTDEAPSKCPVCCSEAYDVPISSLGPDVWIYCAEHTPPPVEEGERGEVEDGPLNMDRIIDLARYNALHDVGIGPENLRHLLAYLDDLEAGTQPVRAPDARQGEGDEDYWSCPVCGGRFPQEMVDRAAADAGIPCPLCKRQVKVAERIEMETLLRDYFEALDEYRSITRPGRAGSGFAEASKRVTSAEDRLRETLSGLRSTPQGAFDGD